MDYKYKYIKYKKKYLQLKYINLPNNKIINVPGEKLNLNYSDGNKICVTRKTAKDIAIFDEKEDVIIIPNPAEYILYHDQRVRKKCIKLRKINRKFYDKFVESRKKYDKIFKQDQTLKFYCEKTSIVDLHKMYPDYKYLYENIKEKEDFIKLRLKLNNILKHLHKYNIDCCFLTPKDIKDYKDGFLTSEDIKEYNKNGFSQFTSSSSFILHKENTKERLLEVSSETKENKNMLVSNYDNLMYMFKNALKDNSIYCKKDFNKSVLDNIFKRLHGFNKVNVFYHFIIFFQELHRIKELYEKKEKHIIIKDRISINIRTKNIRQYLIKNINNIREYFFKEYSNDFEDKTELLDNMYLIDYIIYEMNIVYNDIVDKLKKGWVYDYIMSIIVGFKKLKNLSIFEDYLDKIKSLKIKNKDDDSWQTVSKKGENDFTTNAKLFVDNVCPMELKISIDQIKEYYYNYGCKEIFNINTNNDYNNDFAKKYNMNFYKYYNHLRDNFINIKKQFYDHDKNFYDRITKDLININDRPLILGTNKTYFFTSLCGTKFLVKPWMYIFNKKLSWHISLNKWMVSCLMKRKQDIKGIIVHKNPDEKDKYKNKKVYMRISMFNERKELNLEMKNFIGCMIHKLIDGDTNKFYISYLFNNNGSIEFYNSRSSLMYPKDLLAEAFNLTYIELNTLLYYNEDIGEKLHFYLYKANLILISTKTLNELTKKYPEIIELQLIKTDTLKDFIFIKK